MISHSLPPLSPASLGASEAARRLHDGRLDAETLARACLARLHERDAQVRAWVHVDETLVLAQARELDRAGAAGPKGPLHGLPVGIKDVILTADQPTQYNSALYRSFAPHMDASCVSLLRAAGALIFGKTDTVEFAATGRRALTRNPHDLQRTPGASSSGSAAAVADGHVPLALGTQTGGSMMRPASYCGVHAMKPTWGLVSTEGVRHFAPSLDTLGWYGRGVDDLALLHAVFDPEPGTVVAPAPRAARFAMCRTPMWERADPPMRQAMADAEAVLQAAGVQVTHLELPPAFKLLPELQLRLMRSEARASFLSEYRRFGDGLHASLREPPAPGKAFSTDEFAAAHDLAARCRADFDALAAPFDAVIVPSATGFPPVGLQDTGDLVFNGLWTLLHVPCIHVPHWQRGGDLPLGLTLVGPRYADRRVLGAAQALSALRAAWHGTP